MNEKELQIAYDKYETFIADYAQFIFDTKIKPFCDKKGYTFLSGNGTWTFHYKDKNNHLIFLYEDDLPKRIYKYLTIIIPGFTSSTNELGLWMNSYNPIE